MWSVVPNDARQARLPVLVLVLLPLGALVGLARTPDAATISSVATLVTLSSLAVLCLPGTGIRSAPPASR